MQHGLFTDFFLPSTAQNTILDFVGAKEIVIGLNAEESIDPKLHWGGKDGKSPMQRLIETMDVQTEAGRIPNLMTWLHPNKAYVQIMAELMAEAIAYSDATVEFAVVDIEGIFKRLIQRQKTDINEFIQEAFLPLFIDVMHSIDVKVAITSFAACPWFVVPFLPYIDAVVPQAYSVWMPSKKWTMAPSVSPGNMQRLAVNSWSKRFEQDSDVEIIMALPNYALSRPGMDAITAYDKAYDTTVELGIKRHWDWSLKHINYLDKRGSSKVAATKLAKHMRSKWVQNDILKQV